MDREGWATYDWFQRDSFPGWTCGILDGVQQDGVGAVEKALRGGFEVGGLWVEYG